MGDFLILFFLSSKASSRGFRMAAVISDSACAGRNRIRCRRDHYPGLPKIEFEHSVDFTSFSAETHGLQRKNAFTHRISTVFAIMYLLTTIYVNFGLFHLGNTGLRNFRTSICCRTFRYLEIRSPGLILWRRLLHFGKMSGVRGKILHE